MSQANKPEENRIKSLPRGTVDDLTGWAPRLTLYSRMTSLTGADVDTTGPNLDAWKSQLRKGAAELAVLAALAGRERYGLEILDQLRRKGGLEIADGTIYQLLNRLNKEGKVVSRWQEDPGASHPRKYYALTPEGVALLAAMREAWTEHTRSMDRLIEEQVSS
jgi:PadR family transcriptional regulator, regulatory protein PadR